MQLRDATGVLESAPDGDFFECWGAHLSGTRAACSPVFSPNGNHMSAKFCRSCVEVGVIVPAARVRALWPSQHASFVNSHGRSPWSAAGWRVVNHTKRCHGPHLLIFQNAAPLEGDWAPLPPEWMSTDEQYGGSYLRLVSKNGTLCPLPPGLAGLSHGARVMPISGLTASAIACAPCAPLPKRARDEGSMQGDVCDAYCSGGGHVAPHNGGVFVHAAGALSTYTGGSSSPTCSSSSSKSSAVATTAVAVPPACLPVAPAYMPVVPTAVAPAMAVAPAVAVPPATAVAVAAATPTEPPSARFLWHALAQLQRMVRARLEYDQGTHAELSPLAPTPSHTPSGHAAGDHPAGHEAAVPVSVPPLPVVPSPALHTVSANGLLTAIDTTAACLVNAAPAPPRAAVPPCNVPHASQHWAAPAPPPPTAIPVAGALSIADAQLDAHEIDAWLATLHSPSPPSPPTSPPGVVMKACSSDRVVAPKGVGPPRVLAPSPARRAAASIVSFLSLWWHDSTPAPILPTGAAPPVPRETTSPQWPKTAAAGPPRSWLATCLAPLSEWGLLVEWEELTKQPFSNPLVAALPLGVLSGSLVFYLNQHTPQDLAACAFGFFGLYLLLSVLGQRLVHVYTAGAWLDAFCQLYTCLLADADKAVLNAEMARPDAVLGIRMTSAASGLLLGLLPRATTWKLSLYVCRQLLVLAVVINHSASLRALGPVRSFVLDSCAPFLLLFGAVEVSSRAWQARAARQTA